MGDIKITHFLYKISLSRTLAAGGMFPLHDQRRKGESKTAPAGSQLKSTNRKSLKFKHMEASHFSSCHSNDCIVQNH